MREFVIGRVGAALAVVASLAAQDAKKIEAGKQLYSAKECSRSTAGKADTAL
jgi:hypothetical protein